MNLIKRKIFRSAFLNIIILTTLFSGAAIQCPAASRRSAMAVLPLQSELGPEAGYIGQAIGQILTSRLAALGIKTVDPLAVHKAVERDHVDLSLLPDKLGAAYVVSGHVVGSGEHLQIFLSLFCAQNGQTMEIHSRPVQESQMLAELGSLADRIKLLAESACTPQTEGKISSNNPGQGSIRLQPPSDVGIKASGPRHDEESGDTTQEQHPVQANRDEYDEGDNLIPDYPVPVDEDISRKSEKNSRSDTAKREATQKTTFGASGGEKAAPARNDNGKGWLSWLMPWRNNHADTGQKMTALTSKLPYPPPGVTDMQSIQGEDAGLDVENPQDMQHAFSDQGQKKSSPDNIPAEGPIWQWR